MRRFVPSRQAAFVRLARRHTRRLCRERPCGGAVQEHPQGLLSQQPPHTPRDRRRGGRGSESGPRHRHGDPYRQARGDEAAQIVGSRRCEHGRHQAGVPQGQACRHREIRRGPRPRGRHHDSCPPDSRRPQPQYENRRCGVSGRRQQGHILLHSRRTRRFPAAYQDTCRNVQGAHRDEADRRPSGSRTHRRHRPLRPSAVLLAVDDQLCVGGHKRRALSGHIA